MRESNELDRNRLFICRTEILWYADIQDNVAETWKSIGAVGNFHTS